MPMSNKSTPLLDRVFSEVTPITVPDFTIKEPKEIADELIQKHFLHGDFSCMLPREKEAIRNCIMEALSMGAIQTLIAEAKDPLSLEIAKDAVAFEQTLEPNVLKTRIPSGAHPWGWRYVNEDLQKRFRDFCKSREKKG